MTSHVSPSRLLAALLMTMFVASLMLAPSADATPRQPSIAQKGENHKAECAEYGDSFESGTYTDADTGAITNYSVCFSGDSMVICEWTATTDFCLGAFPNAIRHGDSQLPPIDEFAPLAPAVPTAIPSNARD
jgi:hypothetical protein